MGKADAAVKNWLGDKRRFADLFNGVLFGGEQVLTENSLEELKGESDIILRNKDEKDKTLQRYRDIVMRWSRGTGNIDRGVSVGVQERRPHISGYHTCVLL